MRQDDMRAADMLRDPDTIGTPMFILILDRFTMDVLDWEPQTLRSEIQREWNVEPPQENMDKIWALIDILGTNLFNTSLEFFIHACNALSGNSADFQNYDPATVQEMCWALAEQHTVHPLDEGEDFSSEILEYMKASLREEGFVQVPQFLKPHVGDEMAPQDAIEGVLGMDSIDFNGFWDAQVRKRIQIDEYVTDRLRRLLAETAVLPLREGDREAVEQLQARADKALAKQRQATGQARESVAPTPFS